MYNVIDVSEHQGAINFAQVKASGKVDGAIIRVGYTGYGKAKSKLYDKYFELNYAGFQKVGIPLGVYWYSCATTEAEAKVEASLVLKAIKGKDFPLGIYFDTEDYHDITKYAPQSQKSIGKQALTKVALAFLKEIEKEYPGQAGIYASTTWLNNQLDMSKLPYSVWVAHWGVSKPTYKGSYIMWQYSSDGSVPGINGRVDVNYYYGDKLDPQKEPLESEKAPEVVQDMKTENGDESVIIPSLRGYVGVSLVDALKEYGFKYDLSYRRELAQIMDIINYKGSAKQNLDLLGRLKNARRSSRGLVIPHLRGYVGASIVDGLKMFGYESSLEYRAKIAKYYGIENYTGTAGENAKLLSRLRA